MTDVIEARPPAGTHTVERRWAETETPKQVVGLKQPVQSKLSEGGVAASQVDILRFVSGDKEHSTGLSRIGTFLVASTQGQTDVVLESPDADLPARFWCALPVLARIAPGEEFLPAEVVERLLGCYAFVPPQHIQHSVSSQVELSADKWMAQVRAWASSHPQRDRVVDDSRESIYGDRDK